MRCLTEIVNHDKAGLKTAEAPSRRESRAYYLLDAAKKGERGSSATYCHCHRWHLEFVNVMPVKYGIPINRSVLVYEYIVDCAAVSAARHHTCIAHRSTNVI